MPKKFHISPECEHETVETCLPGKVSAKAWAKHFKKCKWCQKYSKERGPILDAVDKEMDKLLKKAIGELKKIRDS